MGFQKKSLEVLLPPTEMKAVPQQKNKNGLYLTAGLLVLGFIILVALVFIFAGFYPRLFGKCVAVVKIDQELTTEGIPSSLFSSGSPSSMDIANAIEKLDERPDVSAVVLVMNSPGGSVVATHDIYDAVKNLSKPKVAYFKEVAASGAYYISTPSDYIISDPDAITGSIGVIATFADMSGLFDKIGLNVTAVKSGAHKDIGSSSRPLTGEEKKILHDMISEIFTEFKAVVLENRGDKLNKQKFEEILDGRIVTGRQAKVIGLVDALGKERDAIKKASELAGMDTAEEPRICEVSTMSEGNQLFNLEGFVHSFLMENSQMKISYK